MKFTIYGLSIIVINEKWRVFLLVNILVNTIFIYFNRRVPYENPWGFTVTKIKKMFQRSTRTTPTLFRLSLIRPLLCVLGACNVSSQYYTLKISSDGDGVPRPRLLLTRPPLTSERVCNRTPLNFHSIKTKNKIK